VGIADLKNQLSMHLHTVEAGAEVEVTDRDRPIARIVPVRPADQMLVRPPAIPFASIRGKRYTPAGWTVNSTDLLVRERQGR